MKVNIKEAQKSIILTIKAGLVAMVSGDPGIGKSAIVHAIAEEYNLKLIDIRLSQCDPTDLNGFPFVVDGIATYVPMDIFPLENTTIPSRQIKPPVYDPADINKPIKDQKILTPAVLKQYSGFLIFLDEANSASLAVQAASYKMILDNRSGSFR